jgi:uncharacterized protein YjbJ (UPF0337 family)
VVLRKCIRNVNQNKMESANKTPEAFKITGNWEKQSKELKSKFSQLTDSDLKFESGRENELLKKVETRLNKNREEVINIIKKLN